MSEIVLKYDIMYCEGEDIMHKLLNNLNINSSQIIGASIYMTIIEVITVYLFAYNYRLGTNYCNMFDIADNFSLTSIGFGIALEIAVVLTLIELGVIKFIFDKLKKLNI